ncbi:DUF938 domain-containing protein [Pseudoalteromonas obscura]|uniref:DUF938 domain-containing protein n=1 Tax=Pseudoalteromonas obscura TaxID=3048491 RepID=A0ABT7ERW0_9GAMM|nr:DUF938 domain-containing protein [Pseudoalteromonas sp. P94(2023)]MDK2597710.1 DUF938 domain-containing protein [Pseudoalteromonas sp. P94(2023)]
MTKPFSQACENNKDPILALLAPFISNISSVLEVGSGTGQHAVHFAQALPEVVWQTSDLACNHAGITQWCDEAQLDNLRRPITLDLTQHWPVEQVPAIYTANTFHIVSPQLVVRFFEGVKRHLSPHGKVVIYGPFNYQGQYTSVSNAEFDAFLKSRDPNSGIRDIEWIVDLAQAAGLELEADHAMPANNRLLCFIGQ